MEEVEATKWEQNKYKLYFCIFFMDEMAECSSVDTYLLLFLLLQALLPHIMEKTMSSA